MKEELICPKCSHYNPIWMPTVDGAMTYMRMPCDRFTRICIKCESYSPKTEE